MIKFVAGVRDSFEKTSEKPTEEFFNDLDQGISYLREVASWRALDCEPSDSLGNEFMDLAVRLSIGNFTILNKTKLEWSVRGTTFYIHRIKVAG